MKGDAKVEIEVERVTVPDVGAAISFSSDVARDPPREATSRREWRVTLTATCLAGSIPRSVTASSQAADPQVAMGGALYEAAQFFLRKE